MTLCSGQIFRHRLQSIHKDMNKIIKMLRLAKKDQKSIDRGLLREMIGDTKLEIANIEKDIKEQKMSEDANDWFYSLGRICN